MKAGQPSDDLARAICDAVGLELGDDMVAMTVSMRFDELPIVTVTRAVLDVDEDAFVEVTGRYEVSEVDE